MIEDFVTCMKEKGWNIERNEMQGKQLADAITKRYGNIPQQWLEFIGSVKSMVSADDTKWFLCAEDFDIQGDKAFQWNEWEIISLDAAEDDAEWQNEIKKFWDNHLPIVMSVKDGYSYYAIAIKDGSVVCGQEPEFEECEAAAASFADFMEKIIKGELDL